MSALAVFTSMHLICYDSFAQSPALFPVAYANKRDGIAEPFNTLLKNSPRVGAAAAKLQVAAWSFLHHQNQHERTHWMTACDARFF